MVRRVAFAVPGDLATPTGGYAYARRIIAELPRLGWQVDVVGLGEGFPHPTAAQKAFARKQLAAVAKGRPLVVDGLAFGVLPQIAVKLRDHHPLIALVHHPLALETGVSPKKAEALRISERTALAPTHAVITSSTSMARVLAGDYGVEADRITVAPPGTERAVPAVGSSDGIVRLVSVGAVVPRKGFDVLIAALSELSELPWRLTIAGDRNRDAATAARLDDDIARHSLGERVAVLGAVAPERVTDLYRSADLFVLASHLEGYGMAFAEAIAHGLPVIGTTGGAIPETVPKAAGVLVPPGDVAALAAALRRLIENSAERQRFAAGARAAGTKLPTWNESARLFAGAIEAVA